MWREKKVVNRKCLWKGPDVEFTGQGISCYKYVPRTKTMSKELKENMRMMSHQIEYQ